MPGEFNADEAKAGLEKLTGQLLTLAAIECQTTLKNDLARQFPPASKDGEYPARRSGNLLRGIGYEPEQPEEVGKAGRIKFGVAANAHYGAILEVKRNRKLLRATVDKCAGKIEQLGAEIPKL